MIHIAIENSAQHVKRILRALPEWFGQEDSVVQYIKDAETIQTFLAKDGENVIGFLMIKNHFTESTEIHCLGVMPEHHRTGIGRILVKAVENHLKKEGRTFLQIKTVSDDRECEAYAKTRMFYLAMGFTPLEVFPTLWDESNPCLLLVKSLV